MTKWIKMPSAGQFRGEGQWMSIKDAHITESEWQEYAETKYLPTYEGEDPKQGATKVAITLGSGAEARILENGHLQIAHTDGAVIDLGIATERSMKAIGEYFNRLSIHGVQPTV